jgi:integrase
MLAAKLEAKCSPRRAAMIRGVLRRALGQAARLGLVGRNVAALAAPPRQVKREFAVLSVEQARQLIAGAREHDLGPLITLALASGARQGELLGLDWQACDLDKGTLHIRRQLQHDKYSAAERWRLCEPKSSASRRTLRLPPLAIAALRQQRARQNAARLMAGDQWRPPLPGLVFTDPFGQPLAGYIVTKGFQRVLASLGLPKVRFHDLRHSAAVLMLEQGSDLYTVAAQLGHGTITVTANHYAHYSAALRDRAAEHLQAALVEPGSFAAGG